MLIHVVSKLKREKGRWVPRRVTILNLQLQNQIQQIPQLSHLCGFLCVPLSLSIISNTLGQHTVDGQIISTLCWKWASIFANMSANTRKPLCTKYLRQHVFWAQSLSRVCGPICENVCENSTECCKKLSINRIEQLKIRSKIVGLLCRLSVCRSGSAKGSPHTHISHRRAAYLKAALGNLSIIFFLIFDKKNTKIGCPNGLTRS